LLKHAIQSIVPRRQTFKPFTAHNAAFGHSCLPTLRDRFRLDLAVGGGEMKKVMHSFPRDLQSLFPALAAATS
jgi:hypothetical protein